MISANASGVTLDAYLGGVADGNQIVGNLIGTNKAGTAIVAGNVGGQGVAVNEDVTNTKIGSPTGTTPGGACSGGCNLISGNYRQVTISQLSSTTSTTTVQSNMIGLNAAGTGLPANYPTNTSTQTGVEIELGRSSSSSAARPRRAQRHRRKLLPGGDTGLRADSHDHDRRQLHGHDSDGMASAGSGTFINVYGVHIYNTNGVIVGGTAVQYDE